MTEQPTPANTIRGVLNVNKPSGITSYDVIRRIKTLLESPRYDPCLGGGKSESGIRVHPCSSVVRNPDSEASKSSLVSWCLGGEKSESEVRIPNPSSLPCLRGGDPNRKSARPRIGHAGTLDPLAAGVLLVLLGVATKIADYLQGREKEYEARILLGRRTDTDDITGRTLEERPVPTIEPAQLTALLHEFEGAIEQTPPAYSALKIGGTPAYTLARAGKEPDLRPRTVRIRELTIIQFAPPVINLRAVVAKGTYIRALARDIGEKLGCGATLQALARTRSGDFRLDRAVALDALTPAELPARLITIDAALNFLPRAVVRPEALPKLRNGIPLQASDLLISGDWGENAILRLTDADSKILVIARAQDGTLRTVRGIYADT